MVLVILLVKRGSSHHLRLHIYNPLHNFLVLTIYAFGLTLLGHVVKGLGGCPFNSEVLLVGGAILTLRYYQELV
jgi:hypothetical protein